MILLLLPLLISPTLADSSCSLPMLAGSACSAISPSVRFYFDTELQRCLAFFYQGCHGNANNHVSWKQCHQNCIPQDRLMCPGNTAAMKNLGGVATKCGVVEGKCSEDAFCQTGHEEVGICCSEEARKKGESDHSPKCINGAEKYRVSVGTRQFTRLGKDCSTNFCPNGYKCTPGNFYAFCCKK